jgi:glycosyltransferase involved in cell wall biosynthesis
MAERFRIGLNFFFDNNTNSGIVNYVFNIVSALNTLPDAEKPKVVVLHSMNSPIDYLRSTSYPYLEFILFQPRHKNKYIRKSFSLFFRIFKRDIYKYLHVHRKIDCLYPYFNEPELANAPNKIYWVVDFNNFAFAQHYADAGAGMVHFQREAILNKNKVVLSSNDLFRQLKEYYPGYKCDVKILRFASSLPVLAESTTAEIQKKFKLATPYFMSPNQFWEHKNQTVVLDAIAIIHKANPNLKFKVLFSGSLVVNRGKGFYVDQLKSKIDSQNISEYISFMGVLDRSEQLHLMNGASALIQPSLYEGWSTLVEEAKALNKLILLSDLLVHREQIDTNVKFFDPHNAAELANAMIQQLETPASITPVNYVEHVKTFGKEIIEAFKS